MPCTSRICFLLSFECGVIHNETHGSSARISVGGRAVDHSMLWDGLLGIFMQDRTVRSGGRPAGVSHAYRPSAATGHLPGSVLQAMGRLPRVGEAIEAQGWRFEVADLDGRRIDKVLASPVRTDAVRAARRPGAGPDPRTEAAPSP
jgi:hypothetical protein